MIAACTLPADAPSAMRIPISCVRWFTDRKSRRKSRATPESTRTPRTRPAAAPRTAAATPLYPPVAATSRKSLPGRFGAIGFKRRAHAGGELARRQRRPDHEVRPTSMSRTAASGCTSPSPIPARAPDAAHRRPRRPRAARRRRASTGRSHPARPQRPRHRLVDHDHRVAFGASRRRDVAALVSGIPMRRVVAVADHAHKRAGELAAR